LVVAGPPLDVRALRQLPPPQRHHPASLLARQLPAPPGGGPDGHAGHLMSSHPRGVRLERVLREEPATERNRDRRNQAPLPAGRQRHSPARALSDSMAARCCGVSSSRSSFAMLASGIRNGCPVPNTKRSTPIVPSSVSR